MRGVGYEQDAADAEGGRASLVHPVRTEGNELVLVGRGRAGEHRLEFEGLAGEVLRVREAGDFAVGYAVEGWVGGGGSGDAGCHLKDGEGGG